MKVVNYTFRLGHICHKRPNWDKMCFKIMKIHFWRINNTEANFQKNCNRLEKKVEPLGVKMARYWQSSVNWGSTALRPFCPQPPNPSPQKTCSWFARCLVVMFSQRVPYKVLQTRHPYPRFFTQSRSPDSYFRHPSVPYTFSIPNLAPLLLSIPNPDPAFK